MKTTSRILAFSLAFASLTVAAAPDTPKFDPDEALGFLETLGTIQMHDDRKDDIIYYYSPDAKLLATLFKARYAPGAGSRFVEAVETFVSAGLLTAGRSDLYLKRVKPECKIMDAEELERKVTKRCDSCSDGENSKHCSRCGGSGRCSSCDGRGKKPSNITDFKGEEIFMRCPSCGGRGKCPQCNGRGEIELECSDCKGTGRIVDKEAAARIYASTAIQMIKHLCDVGDETEMPELLKRDFKKARENAEKKFGILRELREEEAEAREERERKEQAERQHELEREDSHSDNRLTIAFLTIQKLYEQVGINNAKAERALAANRLSEAELYLNSNNQLFKELKARIKMIEDAASNGNADAIALVNSQKWKDIVGRR